MFVGDTDKEKTFLNVIILLDTTVVHLSRPLIIRVSTSPDLWRTKKKTEIMVMKENRQYTTHSSWVSCSVRGKLVMTDFH